MIQVKIDSIRVSLMSQHRVVVLKDVDTERYLPIWIGPFEADAITIQLQGVQVARPLTHDLLANVIEALGGELEKIVVNDLQEHTFYAKLVIRHNGALVEVDSRPSDAIALGVASDVPLYIADHVLNEAGTQ